jgi:hypothetical protein
VLKCAAECLTAGEQFVNVRLIVHSELAVTGQLATAKGWLIVHSELTVTGQWATAKDWLIVHSELTVTGQWATAKGWLIQVFS